MLEFISGIGAAVAEQAAETAATAATAATNTDPAAAQAEVSPIVSLLFTFGPLILIFVVFWFMMIRPQRKKGRREEWDVHDILEGYHQRDELLAEKGENERAGRVH